MLFHRSPDQLHVDLYTRRFAIAWDADAAPYLAGFGRSPAARLGPWCAGNCTSLRQWECDQQSPPNLVDRQLALHGAADPALAGGARLKVLRMPPVNVGTISLGSAREELISVCRLCPTSA